MSNQIFDLSGRRVLVLGAGGMVGSALVRRLEREDCHVIAATRADLDLRRQLEVEQFLGDVQAVLIYLAAARVGGIAANNDRPGEFIYDNLILEANVIEAARRLGVPKLVFLGSSCIYPREAEQPIREEALLTGPLEPTNQWYAVAKIAGIKMCQAYRRQYGCDFISAQPTNLYGPGDNFDLESSHVVPALIRKAHEAKLQGGRSFTVWGSGAPLREFLHVDDLADALVHLAKCYSAEMPINVGSGEEISIADLARLVAGVVGFDGKIEFDASRPDGTPRKLVDSSRLDALGWSRRISLTDGIRGAYAWFSSQGLNGNEIGRHPLAAE